MNGPFRLSEPAPVLQVGAWRFEHTLNRLSRGDEVRRLPRRQVELLLRLAATAGKTVTREQLLADVWTRRMVNDEVLSRAVAELRQALDDDAREPRYIETIPKLGYRLVAPVRSADGVPTPPANGLASMDTPAPRAVPRSRWIACGLAVAVAVAMGLWMARVPPATDPLTVEHLLRAQPLTSDPGWELSPRFMPDGRAVVYTQVEDPGSSRAAIRIRALDGSLNQKLVDDEYWNLCPTPSPDGRRLAWLRLSAERCALVERALLGGEARELAACAPHTRSCPDWSPDAAALVFTAAPKPGRGPALARVALADLGVREVSGDTPPDMVDTSPRYSPDGARLAFQRGTAWGGRYHVVAVAGGPPLVLGTRAELNYGLAWSRDAGRLLLATDALGFRALAVQALDGGAPRLLGARGARFPDVSRDGALVWEHAEYDANLWLVELGASPGPPRQLTRARRYDAQPEYSPDGRRVAFLSNRDGSERVYVVDLASGEERAVATQGAQRWSQVAWSPDGEALSAIGYDGDESRGCVHVPASGRTECLDALRGYEAVRLVADEGYLALRGDERGHDLWRVDGRGGGAALVEKGVERYWPAGGRLLIQRRDRAGVAVREADGTEHTLAAEFGEVGRGLWSATSEALYVASSGTSLPGGAGIYRIAFDDPRPERVSTELPDAIGTALTIAPDGRHAVIAKTDRLDVDLHWVPPP